ncbi:Svf1-like-domain-containing protein [Pisolithus marmoratus]|nr:Svf1-like-domain-containing protein [Pisolithus marmoratus]
MSVVHQMELDWKQLISKTRPNQRILTDTKASNFHPVSHRPDLFGELEMGDLEWTCADHGIRPLVHLQNLQPRSINVSNFTTPPSGLGSKADKLSITCRPSTDPSHLEMCAIRAHLPDDSQVSLYVLHLARVPEFKVGSGPNCGFSYFVPDEDKPEDYAVHHFWLCTIASGRFIHKGQIVEAKGTVIVVHAIQGMRPDLAASSWNFANF